MNPEPRRISPKLLAKNPKRHVTRELAALPKKSQDVLKKGVQRILSLSPSQPHSKSFGR